MNRKLRRLSAREGRFLMKKGWNNFTVVPDHEIPLSSNSPDKVYKNNIYIVQVFNKDTSWGPMKKALIRRNDEAPIHSWQDLQRVKNEIFGPERIALEVYPRQSRLIDDANIYWLWVFHENTICPIEY